MESVSVIIPIYNSEKTIVDALESVRNQTVFDQIAQIILIDDGSTDDSYKIICDYVSSHKTMPIEVIRQENGGVSKARNVGLEHSVGEWIAFLDADDEWLSKKLERQFEIIEKHPDIDFLGAGYSEKPLYILGKRITQLYRANVHDLTLKNFPCTPSILMRRKIYEEIGGFDEKWKYAEDGQYYMKICRFYNYYYLPEHLVNIGHGKRTFGESGLSGNLKGMYRGNVDIITELRDERVISEQRYIFLRVFYWIKYLRRIVISQIARVRKTYARKYNKNVSYNCQL